MNSDVPSPRGVMREQNEVLAAHLDLAVTTLNRLYCEPAAIVLYGGYGRGEGSWVNGPNGWRPYNDYDFLVVGGKQAPVEEVRSACSALAARFGLRWVDITRVPRWRLRVIRPSIFVYDLRHGSRVVAGRPDILEEVRTPSAANIPVREAWVLFCTRMWTFLGSIPGSVREDLAGEDARFFRNQMAKAVLAAVDALLLIDGHYHTSYAERVARSVRLSLPTATDKETFRWALEEKLRPSAPAMTGQEVLALYDRVHDLFGRLMAHALTIHFGRPVRSFAEITDAYGDWWPTRLVRSARGLPGLRGRYRRVLSNFAQMHVLSSYRPQGADGDQHALEHAAAVLAYLDPALPSPLTWDQARLAAARIRMAV